MPIVMEIIDDEEKVLNFLRKYDGMIGEGMVTLSDVEVLRYKSAVDY